MTDQEDDQTIDLMPKEPENLARMLVQALNGSVTEEGILRFQDVESLVKPYANCMAIVQQLKEEGELTGEECYELIERRLED